MISVEAARTCSAETVRFFSRAATTRAPPGEMIGSSEEASGSLLDGQDGFLGKEMFFHSSDLQVVIQISLHVFEG